ncbi:MAG: hypothetical protein HRU26_04120, partial [Psychroserpens sp.]|nr:hypothetical protein [Psychroserpens sp.]
MKKVTFLLFAMFAFCWQTQAQFTFPTDPGPINVLAGSPVQTNPNDAGNTAGVPTGGYTDFTITTNWTAGGGGPWSSEARVQVTTIGGSTLFLAPSAGGADTGVSTTLTFSGSFVGVYDPDTNGTINLDWNTVFGGSDVNFSNIILEISEPAGPTTVDCAGAGTVNTTYCYSANDSTVFEYVSSDGSNLEVLFNSGLTENTFDELIIWDSDGVGGTQLYNGYGAGGDLTGVTAASSGDTIFVQVTSDGSVQSCTGGNDWDWNVSCLSCTPAIVDSYAVVEDCGAGTFDIVVTFTSLGDAAFVLSGDSPFPFLPIDLGPDAISGTADDVLVYTLAGFPVGTQVSVDVSHGAATDCDFNSGAIGDVCPLANDDCAGAIPLAVNAFGDCTVTATVNMNNATYSGVNASCEGAPATEPDVWYSFTPTAFGGVNVQLTAGAPDIGVAVFDSCGGTELDCIDDLSFGAGDNILTGLTAGVTYFLQVYTETFNLDVYTICLSELECESGILDSATLVEDCGAGTFTVDVVLTTVNSA